MARLAFIQTIAVFDRHLEVNHDKIGWLTCSRNTVLG